MEFPRYVNLDQARNVLAENGIELSHRQLKRAADPDAHGKRKLPFFVDPIDGRLKIDKNLLVDIYKNCQVNAQNNAHINIQNLKGTFDRST
ncbi:hypothetical protein NPS53_11705 [Pseudomonas putida]|uniref:hypothetical protein n=1 Tax=Pseudomonas putida TaxID=303 RepID=UPI0023645176|nr:hypothetical protein [Pseudomonas putida]MDD2140243.1 hypothetical protein [Pseudomonas putida]HDS1725589.1 hypothetical protein [Pseudomonas putida]